MIYRFGTFILDLDRGSLRGSDSEIKLRRQTFRLLIVLVEKAPNILSHEELLDLVWGKEHLSASSLKQAISEVRQALGDNPASPSFVETVHRRGYRFIAPVEEIDARASSPLPNKGKLRRASGWSARSKAPFGIGFLVLLLVGGAVVLWMQDRETRAAPARSSIAILGFTVTSDKAGQEWTSEYLSRTLANELLADAAMRVIPIDRTAEARRDLKIEVDECFDPEVVQRIGRVLGADFVTGGSYHPGDNSNPAILSLIVADALSGQSRLTFHRSAPQGDFVTLTQGLGSELRETLHPPLPSWGELPQSTPKPISMNLEAQRLFITGIHRLRFFDTLAAVDLLTKATRLDPDAPLLRWKLSQALLMSGNQPAAGKAVDEARARADGIPREQQLAIIQANSGDLAGSRQQFLKVLTLKREINDVLGQAHVFDALAQIDETLGNLEDAENWLSDAETLARKTGDRILEGRCIRTRADFKRKTGSIDTARSDYEKALKLVHSFIDQDLMPLSSIHEDKGPAQIKALWQPISSFLF